MLFSAKKNEENNPFEEVGHLIKTFQNHHDKLNSCVFKYELNSIDLIFAFTRMVFDLYVEVGFKFEDTYYIYNGDIQFNNTKDFLQSGEFEKFLSKISKDIKNKKFNNFHKSKKGF